MTAVNALSDYFKMVCYREKENTKHTIVFEKGIKVQDEKVPLGKKEKKHGTIVAFKASKYYLGKDANVPYEMILEWIEKMSYLLKSNIKIECRQVKGLEVVSHREFKSQPFEKYLDTFKIDKGFSPKVAFSSKSSIEELIRKRELKNGKEKITEKNVKKDIVLDVALRYDSSSITYYDTYCNYTNTTDGGVHQDTFEKVYCRYIINKAKETMSDAQKEKLPILWDDARLGLNCIINLSTNAQVKFEGNAKKRIGNTLLVPVLTDMINKSLDETFAANPSILKDYINIVKANAKLRIDMQKLKTASQKERVNNFKTLAMKNYIGCTNSGKQWKEIFIVEGDSASGAARDGCDPKTQAFFLLRGVTRNPMKTDLLGIKENKEWNDFIAVCRAGYGPSFDIKKFYFNRVNIMTDQDVDGFGISAGILVFIYMYMRPLIEAGMVYKVFTPLYRLDDKANQFVANKAEMVAIYQKKLSKIYKIRTEFSDSFMTKSELEEFLEDTYDYDENIMLLAKRAGEVNKFFAEIIIGVITLMDAQDKNMKELFKEQKFVKTFISNVQKVFKEVIVKPNTSVVSGNAFGKLNTVKISSRFIKNSIDLIPVYKKYGLFLYVAEKDKPERRMTIEEFLDESMKYMPNKLHRYKGLGELDAEDIKYTTLDMNNRISVQYTIEDAEKDYETFQMLFSPKKKHLDARKEMMSNYRIKRQDLDN